MEENIVHGSILNILVVGFHHKRGCQVDFCFPPLFEDKGSESCDLPPQWKHLPFLALPDGAHNFDKDTIYFLLPGVDDPKNTVYGMSSYKQMKANDLIRKSSDVTRGTVQKSVVVLSKLPLFGLITVKLQLITHAYFAERDFSKISILKEFFNSLNSSLPRSISDTSEAEVFIGLSLIDLVKEFKHKTLVLFKLMLLERRVLFFGSPVHSVCTCILSVASLFPEMIQSGLSDAAFPRFYKVKTPSFALEDFGIKTDEYVDVDMSNVPNYQQKKTNNGIAQVPPNQVDGTLRGKAERLKSNLDNDGSQKFFRSSSCDSGLKQTHFERNSDESRKLNKSISENEGPCEEDELLNMIDEELFGTYFEEKKRGQVQSESGVHQEGGRDEDRDSANEMSLLLSHDLTSDKGVEDMFESTKSSHDFKETEGIKNIKEETIETVVVDDRVVDVLEDKTGIMEETEKTLPPKQLDLPLSEEKCENHSRTTSESGISSSGGQRWEEINDPSPQTMDHSRSQRPLSLDEFVVLPDLPSTPNLPVDDFGFPLSLFGKGALCYPYMALQQYDLLQDISVRSFVIGASNVLFKHKRQNVDVIVENGKSEVNILDQDLRKQLSLTTADMRFSDYIVNTVLEHHSDELDMNNTGWEGGEEWIRAQFKLYLLSLLATCADQRPLAEENWGDFNESFIATWKTTHNFRIWRSQEHTGIDQVHTRHICHGQLSINDMKIRWNSAMQTERGKNLNNVINKTSVAVSNTGKAVGEAWNSAKSVVSTWLFGFGGDDDDDIWSYEQE